MVDKNDADDINLVEEFKIPKFSTKKNSIIVFIFSFCFLGLAQGAGIQSTGLLLYVQVYKLNLIFVTAISILAGSVFNFCTIYIGIKSDLLKTKYGRRKPFVALGVILISFANFFGTFIPCGYDCSPGFIAAWYFIVSMVASVGSACIGLPYSSWLIESTVGEEDFTFINTVCGIVPRIIGFLGSGLAVYAAGEYVKYLTAVCTTLGLISAILLLVYVPNNTSRKVEKQPPLIPSMRTCFKTKEFSRVFFNETAIQTATALNSDCAQIFVILMVAGTQATFVLLTVAQVVVASMIGLPLLIFLTTCYLKNHDKIVVYQFLTKFLCTSAVSAFFLSIIPRIGPLMFWGLLLLLGAIYFPVSFLQSLFVRDLIQFDTFTTGLKRQAMYQLVITLPANIIAGFIATIPTVIIGFTGYHAIDPPTMLPTMTPPTDAPTVHPPTDSPTSTLSPSPSPTIYDDDITDYYAYNEGSIWQSRVYSTLIVALVGYFAFKSLERYPLTKEISDKILEVNVDREAKKIRIENEAEEKGDDLDEVETRGAMDESIADDNEGMRMQHLSALEINALCTSYMDDNGKNKRLLEIKTNSLITIAFGIINSIVFVYAILKMLLHTESIFVTLFALLFQVNLLMALYEYLRLQAINELNDLSFDTLKAQSLNAYNSNLKYSESLEDLISRNGIQEVMDEAVRDSLAAGYDNEVMDEILYLPGYKRTYTFCSLCLICGLIIGLVYV
jgi:hypothetical protein